MECKLDTLGGSEPLNLLETFHPCEPKVETLDASDRSDYNPPVAMGANKRNRTPGVPAVTVRRNWRTGF